LDEEEFADRAIRKSQKPVNPFSLSTSKVTPARTFTVVSDRRLPSARIGVRMKVLRAISELTPSATGANSVSQGAQELAGLDRLDVHDMSVLRFSVNPNVWSADFRSKSPYAIAPRQG